MKTQLITLSLVLADAYVPGRHDYSADARWYRGA